MADVACQVRVLKGDGTVLCGEPAVAIEFFVLAESVPGFGDPPGPVALAVAVCERHRNEDAEGITATSASDVRSQVEARGATPGF